MLQACGGGSGSDSGGVSLTGQVIREDKTPVPAATVIVDGEEKWSSSTSNDGRFAINNVAAGSRTLRVQEGNSSDSFASREIQVTVTGQTDVGSLVLPRPPTLTVAKINRQVEADEVHLGWTEYPAQDFREYKVYKAWSTALDENTGILLHVATSFLDTTFIDRVPHGSENFYRVFVLNEFGRLAGSNIISCSPGPYLNDAELLVGEDRVAYLNAGETVNFTVNVNPGSLYVIKWKDNWFEGYTAPSIFILVRDSDSENVYFGPERLIQMMGSPRVIKAVGNKLQLSVYGYDSNMSGTFGLQVMEVKDDQLLIGTIGESKDFSLSAGDMKGLVFNLQAGNSYRVEGTTSTRSGAGGDSIFPRMACYLEGSNTPCADDIFLIFGEWKGYSIHSPSTQRIYIVTTGTYWWLPASVSIRVLEE